MLNVEQLKRSVNRMELDDIRQAVDELQMDGLVTDGKTPFTRVHFNTCFAEIEALFQRAGFHRPLDVVGYQGEIYALYDPSRWEAVEVLRWLKEYREESRHLTPARAQRLRQRNSCARRAQAIPTTSITSGPKARMEIRARLQDSFAANRLAGFTE